VADDSRARSIRAVSSFFVRSLRWTEIDRRRAATSSHAGASPARSSFVPLSERLGPGLPNRRAGFDSPAVLETACVDPVMPHGVARSSTSFTRVAKLETQTPVDRPTAGSNPAPGAANATQRTPPPSGTGAALRRQRVLVRIQSAVRALVRYASGKRGGCLPPKASSILVRTAMIVIHARVAQLEEAMRLDRIQCGFESRPGY
jgi:hypothetical protein